jgi:hypothetical protein
MKKNYDRFPIPNPTFTFELRALATLMIILTFARDNPERRNQWMPFFDCGLMRDSEFLRVYFVVLNAIPPIRVYIVKGISG